MMKSGSWASIALIYCYGVLGSASLTKVIPLQADFQLHLGTSPAQFALLLALLSIPPALFATLGGSLADRIGARTTLIGAALAGCAANLAYLQAGSLTAFNVIRVLEGCVLIGVYSAAPALIMATTSDAMRGKAMAFWSTYTPVGVSAGLLLSSHYAGTTFWRGGYALHAGLFFALALLGLLLPRPARATSRRTPVSLLAAYTQTGPLRIALTFGAVVVMGFGTSIVFPSWYASHHGVSLGTASSILAVANLSMIAGGVLTAFLLGRGVRALRLFMGLAACGLLASVALFTPGLPTLVCLGALGLWLVSSGASTAVVTSSLPRVLADPSQGAAAAGLLGQVAALTTFVTPQIWLPVMATGQWGWFIVIVALSWTAALALLPVRGR
jgi:MFS family permease